MEMVFCRITALAMAISWAVIATSGAGRPAGLEDGAGDDGGAAGASRCWAPRVPAGAMATSATIGLRSLISVNGTLKLTLLCASSRVRSGGPFTLSWSTATMISPLRNPAFAAGVPGPTWTTTAPLATPDAAASSVVTSRQDTPRAARLTGAELTFCPDVLAHFPHFLRGMRMLSVG